MKKCGLFFVIAMSVGIFFSCSDKSSNPGNQQVKASLYQVGGCQSHLAKVSEVDSCFSYQFGEKLVVDFCLTGNCCPDSNRFVLSHKISNDTIYIVAVDTAEHLCRCICKYVIHAEFENLPLSHYIFYCADSNIVYYDQVVQRNNP
jgi:hypothetical protein